MKGIRKILIIIILMHALFTMHVNAQDYSDYEVKAIFIEKFTNYIKWPENIINNDTAGPVVICVFGESNFYEILKDTYKNKEISGREVVIKQIFKIENLPEKCNILFVPECGFNKLHEILKVTRNKPILTISDTDNYAALGILINFVIMENKVLFEINKSAVINSGLEFDFRLIKIAKEI